MHVYVYVDGRVGGDIWIRYGKPERMINNVWSYGELGPNFVFVGQLARHASESKFFEEDLGAGMPEWYRPRTITEAIELPHQTAAFRGAEAGRIALEVHGLVDAGRLQAPADSGAAATVAADAASPRSGELEAGLFLFDALYNPVWRSTGLFPASGERPVALTYRVGAAAGRFRYGLEARMAGPDTLARPVARARHEIELPELWGALAISDLLLAESIEVRAPEPARRSDLTIVPRRSVQVPATDAHLDSLLHHLGHIYTSNRFEPVMGTYRALESSGGLAQLRDDSLRRALAEFAAQLDVRYYERFSDEIFVALIREFAGEIEFFAPYVEHERVALGGAPHHLLRSPKSREYVALRHIATRDVAGEYRRLLRQAEIIRDRLQQLAD